MRVKRADTDWAPMLKQAEYLDVRNAVADAGIPLARAAHIPLAELSQRTHELPPRDEVIRVADTGPEATEAVRWLAMHGRKARLETACEHASEVVDPAPHWRLWRPSMWVAEVASGLPCGRGLDLACGTGRDAVFLAAAGWEMTAVDWLPDAIERARALEAHYLRDSAPIDWRVCDLTRADAQTFDRPFDLILGVRFLHRPLLTLLWHWLRLGGSVVWETFTTLHRERHGRPTSADHVLEPDELRELFSDWEIVRYDEGWEGAAHTAKIWARQSAEGMNRQPGPLSDAKLR